MPEDLKTQPKKNSFTVGSQIQLIIYGALLAVSILVILNLYLLISNTLAGGELKALNSKWVNLETQRKTLDVFQKEKSVFASNDKLMQQILVNRISWSEKMNKLSLKLPSGVWFNELVANRKELVIKGSMFSTEKQEVFSLNKFVDDLKADPKFSKEFEKIEISSLQRKRIGGYDVVDFVLSAKLKIK